MQAFSGLFGGKPKSPPLPEVPKTDSAAAQEAAERERRVRSLAGGRSSNILTGDFTAEGTLKPGRAALLGG